MCGVDGIDPSTVSGHCECIIGAIVVCTLYYYPTNSGFLLLRITYFFYWLLFYDFYSL